MRKSILYKILFAVLLLAVLLGSNIGVSAREIDQMPELEPGRKGTLSATLSYDNLDGEKVYIEGITLEIFRVADLFVVDGGSSKYTLSSEFADSGVDFEGIQASVSNEVAKQLTTLAVEKELAGIQGTTNSEGKVYFYDMEPGMYLVVQTGNKDNIPLYTYMDPYLVSVPLGATGGEHNTWNYTVDTIPKTEIEAKPRECSIHVTKRLFLEQGKEDVLLNSKESIFYVGLFKDAAGTILYNEESIKLIHITNSSAGSVTFSNLTEGTYYVYETDENGTPIMPGETSVIGDQSFVCELGDGTSQKIILDPYNHMREGKVTFDNIFEDLPEEYHVDGRIRIKKSVFQKNDRVIVDDTFYAGIFTSENGQFVLNQIVSLEQNKTVEVDVILTGQGRKDSFEYWIFETDREGKMIDKQKFSYEVSGEGSIALNSKKLRDGVEIINKIKDDVHIESVKTGDETPVGFYILLLISSLMILFFAWKWKRTK